MVNMSSLSSCFLCCGVGHAHDSNLRHISTDENTQGGSGGATDDDGDSSAQFFGEPMEVTASPIESTPSPVAPAESTTTEEGTSSGCAKKFAQCGGLGFDGSDCCEDNFECSYVNDWYSQCVP